MLFTGPFQPERYVCFVLPKNKSLPSECGFCWNLCQSAFPGRDTSHLQPRGMCPCCTRQQGAGPRPLSAAFSVVPIILATRDLLAKTGNRRQGCHSKHYGDCLWNCLTNWTGLSHRAPFLLAVHVTGLGLASLSNRSLEKIWLVFSVHVVSNTPWHSCPDWALWGEA